MDIDINRMSFQDFQATIQGFAYEQISGNWVHESIGPIWYWVGRYMERQSDDCPSFWNIYSNQGDDTLAIEWRREQGLQYKECKRIVIENWKPQQE